MKRVLCGFYLFLALFLSPSNYHFFFFPLLSFQIPLAQSFSFQCSQCHCVAPLMSFVSSFLFSVSFANHLSLLHPLSLYLLSHTVSCPPLSSLSLVLSLSGASGELQRQLHQIDRLLVSFCFPSITAVCVCASMSLCLSLCVCVCVCVWACYTWLESTHTSQTALHVTKLTQT